LVFGPTRSIQKPDLRHTVVRRREPLGLGRERWVVERTFAWLHGFRRLRTRYERLPELHQAFLDLGCAVICLRMLGWT
jgi:transposase